MKKKYWWLILLILGVSLFLRLFKVSELFHFTMDEELIAFRAWGLFELNRPFLIGAASPLQFHLPPYFFYAASFLLAPFKFNPLGWGVSAAIIGVLTVYGLYRLASKHFGQKTGLMASVFYATSFTAVFFDRHFWPMTFNPLTTILALLLLGKIGTKRIWPYLALACLLVFSLSADPSNLPLFLSIALVLFLRRKKINRSFSLAGIGTFVSLFFLPLIIFDWRHQGANFAGISRFFNATASHQFALSKVIDALLLLPRSLVRFWLSPQTDIIELHSYCFPHSLARVQVLPLVFVIIAAGLLIWLIRTSLRSPVLVVKTIGYLVLFYAFGIIVFGGLGFPIFDHYLSGLLPVFALVTALIVTKLPRILQWVAIVLFVFVNLWQIAHARNPYSMQNKLDLVSWANQEFKGQEFALDSISKCHRENGLRYLFEISGQPPTMSFMDPNFFWLYREPTASSMPERVLMVTDKDSVLFQPVITSRQFGAMKAFILDNSYKNYKIELF